MSTNRMLDMLGSCRLTCNVISCWKWDLSFIMNPPSVHKKKYAVVILNQIITQNQEFIKDYWNNATVRITVDGGTVHWNNFLSKLPAAEQQNMKLPDLITGDFDSITEDVMQKFKNEGCKIIQTPDQDHTDFTKALMELNTYCTENNCEVSHVLAVGKFSGRIDQILSNIETLFLVRSKKIFNANTHVYIMSDDSLSWLLYPGDHLIDIPQELREDKNAWCSMVPVGETCNSVTTNGLKWNLDNHPLKYGFLISTSNSYHGSQQVKIKCSNTLFWSMMIPFVKGA